MKSFDANVKKKIKLTIADSIKASGRVFLITLIESISIAVMHLCKFNEHINFIRTKFDALLQNMWENECLRTIKMFIAVRQSKRN